VVPGTCPAGYVCCDVPEDTDPEPCPVADDQYGCIPPTQCTIAFPAVGEVDTDYYCGSPGYACCHCYLTSC
jgi:hypothetical protein